LQSGSAVCLLRELLPAFSCEHFPGCGHVLKLLFLFRVFHGCREMAALLGVLLVLGNFSHDGPPACQPNKRLLSNRLFRAKRDHVDDDGVGIILAPVRKSFLDLSWR
jgi:hypothetical protein